MTKSPRTKRSIGVNKSRSVTSDLEKRIARAKNERSQGDTNSTGAGRKQASGHSRAARLGTEFIAAVLVGAAIGYIADTALGTGPWVMLVMLLVGFASGVLNVVRAAAQMNAANPPPLNADLGPEDDDEDY